MPGKVRVKVVAGRNLPVMDRSSDTTDAFAEVKLGDTTYKTDVYRKSLNPAWNSDWFKFEVDDLELQDEPLQIRIMDYDTYSANDAIGKVYIDLNPLLLPQPATRAGNTGDHVGPGPGGGNVMSGWLPIYDTMNGIRGEVQIIVKVELFSDLNKFRQSSCGVQFFCCSEVPEGYKAQFIPGFVEELVVNDDPEYKLIDKIRTSRASNEARQLLFSKLSGELKRKIGLKALELGGNAVIGYKQTFDLEGESGVVVRGIGTAVTLSRLQPGDMNSLTPGSPSRCSRENSTGPETCDSPQPLSLTPEDLRPRFERSVSASIGVNGNQRQDQGDHDTPPRGASVGSSSSEKHSGRALNASRALDKDMPEYPFLTINKFPPGFLLNLGGMVSSKSVKLLEELDDRDESDARESWWVEIRQEVRSHAKALGCNMIVGYQEKTVIWEDVLILSACGTAAVCNLGFMAELDGSGSHCLLPGRLPINESKSVQSECSLVHIPYLESSVPFPIKLSRCGGCSRGKVPDILLTTVEPPLGLEIVGQGGLIQARVLKTKKDLKGENNAREVSEILPFIEYEVHRQLVNKLRVKGMNAIFGLNVTMSLCDRMLVVLATGTAVFLSLLPNPEIPQVSDSTSKENNKNHIVKLQSKIQEKVEKNKEHYGLAAMVKKEESVELEMEEKCAEMELCTGNKDTCVLELDDIDDADIVDSLMDSLPPAGYQVISVHTPIGEDWSQQITTTQTFSQLWRSKLSGNSRDFSTGVQQLVTEVCFKLRRLQPCLISSLNWGIELDEENEIQINMTGVAIGFASREKNDEKNENVKKKETSAEREMMFLMEDNASESDKSQLKLRTCRQPQFFFTSGTKPFGINLTPTSYVPGARIEHHLGSLNFFFIRESSNVRETGGLSSFVQQFLNEVLGILRSHVASLGGNAVTSYFMSYCVISFVPHKYQAQCLVNTGGDVVRASYVSAK